MDHVLFIHSFVIGHLSSLFLANVNNPSVNIGVQISVDVLKGQFLICRSLQLSRLKKNLAYVLREFLLLCIVRGYSKCLFSK